MKRRVPGILFCRSSSRYGLIVGISFSCFGDVIVEILYVKNICYFYTRKLC